jgi:hypothetical protein
MKIEIELPDWCDERHIWIMAGTELAAYKDFGSDKWFIKKVRCNRCGKCCMNLVDDGQYELDENKNCVHLKSDGDFYVCDLGIMRPIPCCEGDLEKNKENQDGTCCIRYEAK